MFTYSLLLAAAPFPAPTANQKARASHDEPDDVLPQLLLLSVQQLSDASLSTTAFATSVSAFSARATSVSASSALGAFFRRPFGLGAAPCLLSATHLALVAFFSSSGLRGLPPPLPLPLPLAPFACFACAFAGAYIKRGLQMCPANMLRLESLVA